MSQLTVEVKKYRHHGGSGRRTRMTPKGRQVDQAALDEVRALLGERPRRRDLLIEFLHLIQDEYRCLRARHLVALADEMRLPMAEVHEVATFYAHFDVIDDDAPEPARASEVPFGAHDDDMTGMARRAPEPILASGERTPSSFRFWACARRSR